MAALILGMTMAGGACLEAAQTEKAEAGIEFLKTARTITAGKSFVFQAEVTGTEEELTWSVSDERIAKVNGQGKVTGIRAGKVRLTAAAGEAKESRTVVIKGKKIIAIDPGHQGKGNSALEAVGPGAKTRKPKVATGTQGIATKAPEYKLTLEVSKKLKQELQERGYEVVMTREKQDIDISNKERAVLANESGADICVRIHADGAAGQSAKGASTLYPSSRNPYIPELSEKSRKLSKNILEGLCRKTGAKNRGIIQRDDLTGTNWSKIPVTVVEMGFMTNPAEDRLMQTKAYQDKLASGIADGIEAYYK